MTDSREFLKFPDLLPVDHGRHCQLYSNVLTRNDGRIAVDEIDDLQMDLETLLIAAVGRLRKLQAEVNILSDVGEGKKDKKKDSDSKRMKSQEDRPLKKLKTSDSPAHLKHPIPGSSGSSVGKPKARSTPVKVLESAVEEEQQPLYQPTRVPVQEAPSKFWQSVEPYCQPIQPEAVKMLEQMYQSQQDNEEYFKIPELGVPFSQRWAVEDMREEQREGNRANMRKFDKSDDSVQTIMKKAMDSIEPSDVTPFGSLTQRLISAFVEENIMLPPDSAATMIEATVQSESSAMKTDSSSALKTPKQLPAINAQKLENRIKLELIEQGILEPDCVESNDEDEILSELKSCQQELKAISKQNRDVLKQLLNVAKEEMKKQEIRRKIDSVNTEVMEQYRRVSLARQKKRTLMKKEKDSAWKALRDREHLIKQLEKD